MDALIGKIIEIESINRIMNPDLQLDITKMLYGFVIRISKRIVVYCFLMLLTDIFL